MMLPIVFIDSFSQTTNNINDTDQQEHFKNETQKLWDFAINSPEFPFKTIEDVLDENYKMRDEIEWLNEVITNNISELTEKLERETEDRRNYDNYIEDEINEVEDDIKNDIEDLENTPRFLVKRVSGGHLPSGTITYAYEIQDTANCFSISSGRFIAPQSGHYYFHFDAEIWGNEISRIDVYKNS